jgi:hypothetical protein
MAILELTHQEQKWLDKLKYNASFHILCYGVLVIFLVHTFNK